MKRKKKWRDKRSSDDTLETCMRLSKRFAAKGLEVRCSNFIVEQVSHEGLGKGIPPQVERRAPIVTLCWLNWTLKHRFERRVAAACLPVVARLPLASLEEHRQMLSERLFADVLAAKLRSCFDKVRGATGSGSGRRRASSRQSIRWIISVWISIAALAAGASRNRAKCACTPIPAGESPALSRHALRKLVGCERCLQDKGCEIENRDELQVVCPPCLPPSAAGLL